MLYSSCSYKQNQLLFAQNSHPADTVRYADSIAPYKIAVQDILQVRNLQNIKYIVDEAPSVNAAPASSLSGQGQTYQVEIDGTVALPVIGRVPVAGLSRLDASKKIEGLYRDQLLKNPIIEVKITNLKVTILGEVRSPGNYQLVKDETTLVEMIGEAGGLTEKGSEKQVKIIRGSGKAKQVIVVDLGDIATLSNPATVLRNRDVIYIAQNKRAIRNDNLQSFSTIMQPALLLINTALVIFTLTR